MPNPDAWAMRLALHQVKISLTESNSTIPEDPTPWRASCRNKTVWDADPKRARYLAVAGALASESLG